MGLIGRCFDESSFRLRAVIAATVMACLPTASSASATVTSYSMADSANHQLRIDGTAVDDTALVTSDAGDVNGDGIDDFVVAAPGQDFAGRVNAGAVYVVFGSASFSASELNIDQIGTSTLPGFVVKGAKAGHTVGSVDSVDDINGDGLDDILIGAPSAEQRGKASTDNRGLAYVVYGKTSESEVDLDLLDPAGPSPDPSLGYMIAGPSATVGAAAAAGFGDIVSKAGDVNGDSYQDFLIEAKATNYNGSHSSSAYVIYSSAGEVDLNVVGHPTSTEGYRIDGPDTTLTSTLPPTMSVASAGDVNGDGTADQLVGVASADFNAKTDSGAAWVVYGDTTATVIDLSTPSAAAARFDGSNGGIYSQNGAGWSVSGTGDLNGDGFDDFMTAAPLASSGGGVVYVVFGSSALLSSDSLESLAGTTGYTIVGADDGSGGASTSSDMAGTSLHSIGDINGDGIDDQLVGAGFSSVGGLGNISSNDYQGSAYVVFGRASSSSTINLENLDSDGWRYDGPSANSNMTGSTTSAALLMADSIGDINDDGIPEFLFGAVTDFGGSRSGSVYLTAAASNPIPEVVTLDADSVTETGANLNGSVNPKGETTTYNFEYGPSTDYAADGTSTPSGSAGSGNSAVAVSSSLSSLTSGTTYNYRVIAENDLGFTAYGENKTFTTEAGIDVNGDGEITAGDDYDSDGDTDLDDAAIADIDGDGDSDVAADLDGDGDSDEADVAAADVNGDGEINAEDDVNGDGEITSEDVTAIDVNGDGVINSGDDYDQDGDTDQDDVSIADIGTDGAPDVQPDLNGDGVSDGTDVNLADVDGNGVIDSGDDINDDGRITTEDITDFNGGDLNHDGVVDSKDDANGDGTVNKVDFALINSTTSTVTAASAKCVSLVSGNAGGVISKVGKVKAARAQLKVGSGYLISSDSTSLSLVAPKGGKLPKLKSVTFYVDKTKLAVDKRKTFKTTLSASVLTVGSHTVKAVLTPKKKRGKKKTVRAKITVGDCSAGVFTAKVAKAKAGKNTGLTLSYKAASGSSQTLSGVSLTLPKKSIVKFSDLRKLKKKKVGSLTVTGGSKVTLKVAKKGVKKKKTTLYSDGTLKVTLTVGSSPKLVVTGLPAGATGFTVKLGKKSSKLLKAGKQKPCTLIPYKATLTGSLGETVKLAYQGITSCKKTKK